MKILSEYHCHTMYSKNGHAKGTIEEVVNAAREKGLKEVLITDHGPGHNLFGIERKYFKEVRDEIDRLNKKYDDIDIYMGVEANVQSYKGYMDIKEEDKKYFDKINLGFHFGIIAFDFTTFWNFFVLVPLSRWIKVLDKILVKRSTDAIIKIIEENDIFIVTHPGDKAKLDLIRLAEVCERRGTALEVNSSHKMLSKEDLILLKDRKVMFSVGSDAHSPIRVGDFKSAIERIEEAGISPDRIINKKEL